MKRVKYYDGAICGFDVTLVKNISAKDIYSANERLNEYINIDGMHEEEYFVSFVEAQEYLKEKIESDDNDYYYGMISMYAYDIDFEADPEYGFGECLEYMCVTEVFAEDVEEEVE